MLHRFRNGIRRFVQLATAAYEWADVKLYQAIGPKGYDRFERLRVWWIMLGAGLVLSRVHYGVWLSGTREVSNIGGAGVAPAANAPVEMLIFALVRVPAAVLLAHLVKTTLFARFESEENEVLSGLVYAGTILGVVLA